MRLNKICGIILFIGIFFSETYGQSERLNSNDPSKKEEKIFVNYQKAREFARKGKYRKASRYYKRAFSDCKSECDTILIARAYAISNYGNNKFAKKLLDQAFNINPNRDELLMAYGWVYLGAENGLKSVNYYNRYLIKHPKNNLALFRRGQAYDRIGNDSLATINYVKVYESLKSDTNYLAEWIFQTIGEKAFSKKDFRLAIDAYSRLYAIQSDKIENQILFELGYSYMSIHEFESALDIFVGLSLIPNIIGSKEYYEYCLLTSECAWLLGDYYESWDDYTIILVESRKKEIRGKAYLGRAKVYYDWGEYGLALVDLKNSNELIDPTWDYYYYLAIVYDKIGKDKIQVCETLDLAIQMGIKDPTSLQNAKMLKEKYCRVKSLDPY